MKAPRGKGVFAKGELWEAPAFPGQGEGAQGQEGGWKKRQDAGWENLWGKKNILSVNPTFPARTYPPLVPQRAPQARSVTEGKRRAWCL